MSTEWFYRDYEGQENGPISAADLKRLAQLGEINEKSMIKKSADGRWVPADKVKGLIIADPPVSTSPGSDPPMPPTRRGGENVLQDSQYQQSNLGASLTEENDSPSQRCAS